MWTQGWTAEQNLSWLAFAVRSLCPDAAASSITLFFPVEFVLFAWANTTSGRTCLSDSLPDLRVQTADVTR